MAREAMDVCFRVLKESNKSRFYSYSVRKSALIISHITFRDCRVHSFSDNLSRNSCINNIQRIINQDVTRLKQSLSRLRHNRETEGRFCWQGETPCDGGPYLVRLHPKGVIFLSGLRYLEEWGNY